MGGKERRRGKDGWVVRRGEGAVYALTQIK